MHPNHDEQGTMYVVSLSQATLQTLLANLDGDRYARLAIEVRPDAIPISLLEAREATYMGTLKVARGAESWTPALAEVSIRETSMFDRVTT